jgi:hypothetical protein
MKTLSPLSLGAASLLALTGASYAAAFPQGLITFEDQELAGLDTDFAMQPNPYTDLQGLPTGVTATFTNFNSWNNDPQHTPGGIWLLYGAAQGPHSGMLFNVPVAVPSIWVTTGPYGSEGSSLRAYFNGIEMFAYTNTAFNTLTECTKGASVLIDSIIFSDYEGSEIDDITIVKPTTLLTFSDQSGNDEPANPNPYTYVQGLWPGLTVTFDQFNNWNGSQDHTATADNYLLYGANYDAGGVASMAFNQPVEVPSLWVSTEGGGQPGTAALKGYLNNVEQFTHTLSGGWTEVIAGAGKLIDTIRFIDYGDSWIDDITINARTSSFEPPTVIGAATQVQSVTVHNGSEASFSFVATNNANPPVASLYQWYKNNQLVTNVTGSQFTFLAGPGDANAKVYCLATLPAAANPNHLSLTSSTGTVTVLPGVIYTNGLKVEFFPGASRQDVEAGNVGPASSIFIVSSFELPEQGEEYTRRVSGYFVPPADGNYVFFICADDDSDLFLSTDSDPAHKRLIAQETSWSDARQWATPGPDSDPTLRRSDYFSPDGGNTFPYPTGVPLQQGHLYYMEGVQHQGVGGENFAVTYKLYSDLVDPLDGDPPLLQATNHNIALITSPATNLVWVTQPADTTGFEGQTVHLISLAASSDSEFDVQYQWYRNDNAVAGATTATYTFPGVLADNNTQWHVIASLAEGGVSITSGNVLLTIKPPQFPQGLITFEDQDPATEDTVDFQPNPYTEAQGLPAGVTATFNNWGSWSHDPDHTAPPGAGWLLYGYGDIPGDQTVVFNRPVGVPSFWVTTGPFGVLGSWLTAYLNGVEQFTYTNTLGNTFTEVTLGAGRLIDRIVFSDFGDSEIDDILIVKPTKVVTFSDQVGNDEPANPNPYTSGQGLWPGVTATFDQFNNWNGSTDHTPNTTDNYLLYGANYDAGGIATMAFNLPVEVPSLWVSTQGGGQSGKATLKGFLKGAEQFTYTITAGGWVEVTAGVGKPIDSIRFIDYGDSWIDDVTINAVTNAPPAPVPARLSLVKAGGDTATLSWTGQGRLEESSLSTSGWTTSANQTNPQTLTVGAANKFYRVVYP